MHTKRPWWQQTGCLILLVLFALFLGTALSIWQIYTALVPQLTPVATRQYDTSKETPNPLSLSTLAKSVPDLLGMSEPRVYLLLLKNNTEIRPGGGFIGSYAVMTVDKARPTIHIIDGTEVLDGNAPDSWNIKPPEPISKYLGVSRWFFRDANWSPDFPTNAERALQFYQGEQGILANEIDAVVAVNTDVFADLLAILGPITVEGKTFTSDNAVSLLQADVEFNFADRGVAYEDRKAILDPLLAAIVDRVQSDIWTSFSSYLSFISQAIQEKQLMLYARDPQLQTIFRSLDADGHFAANTVDFLHWSDANLGALKTDKSLSRSLTYTVRETSNLRHVGEVRMNYVHHGSFDAFTTRYQSYVRVYVPQGAQFISFEGEAAPIDQGVFGDYQWFGSYITFEPGTSKEVVVQYQLPQAVSRAITEGRYDLTVVKQSGVNDLVLTLNNDMVDNTVVTRYGEPVTQTSQMPFTQTLRYVPAKQ